MKEVAMELFRTLVSCEPPGYREFIGPTMIDHGR